MKFGDNPLNPRQFSVLIKQRETLIERLIAISIKPMATVKCLVRHLYYAQKSVILGPKVIIFEFFFELAH